MKPLQHDTSLPPGPSDGAPPTDESRTVRAISRLYQTLDLVALLTTVVQLAVETSYQRALLVIYDHDDQTLKLSAYRDTTVSDVSPASLMDTRVAWQPLEDSVQRQWRAGQAMRISRADCARDSQTYWLLLALDSADCFSAPLLVDNRFYGVLLADRPRPGASLAADDEFLLQIAPAVAGALRNAWQHSKTVQESAARLRQLYILRQIDRELSDNIKLEHVFDMTIDWGLRYTNAQAASLAFYNESTGELRYVADIGYEQSAEHIAAIRGQAGLTTAHRVARSGRTEVIPDVSMDKDYMRLSPAMRSQLVSPITREDRVIAVISIESKKLNHFTDDHSEFVEKLNARAGVAIDNARLFSEMARERSKLARILSKTADVVIVVDDIGAIELVNASALAAFDLDAAQTYARQRLEDVFDHPDLLELYTRATGTGETVIGEVNLPLERTFYASVAPCPTIGWIIVMHDITPLKKTERLKNEIIAAVSHDLKQPLGIMHGFAELLTMTAGDNEQVTAIVPQIQRAIANMKQLIDDQLDLARLESGVQLMVEPVYLRALLGDCIESMQRAANEKSLTITLTAPESLPPVCGDTHYLYRVFVNLIVNAVKYTPEHGQVAVSIEPAGDGVRVSIRDNGIGISPEDQSQIFDRFYRVRRPETEGIDGTGIGLAIVKRLVELHHGQIGLESQLGVGSTFSVTLPIYDNPDPLTSTVESQ